MPYLLALLLLIAAPVSAQTLLTGPVTITDGVHQFTMTADAPGITITGAEDLYLKSLVGRFCIDYNTVPTEKLCVIAISSASNSVDFLVGGVLNRCGSSAETCLTIRSPFDPSLGGQWLTSWGRWGWTEGNPMTTIDEDGNICAGCDGERRSSPWQKPMAGFHAMGTKIDSSRHSYDGGGAEYLCDRSLGSRRSPIAVTPGTEICRQSHRAFDGTSYVVVAYTSTVVTAVSPFTVTRSNYCLVAGVFVSC